jgi:glycolate oxidase iron-sulfur subunit
MKLRRDGRESTPERFVKHIDTCLGCMACVTACPSGVQYDALLEAARPEVERIAHRGIADRAFRRAIFEMFPHPARLQWLAWPLGVYQHSGLQALVQKSGVLKLLPERLQVMERLLPSISFSALRRRLPAHVPAEGTRRRKVALLLGCVQRVFFGDVNAATARVLAAEGCDVIIPQDQECCGALAEHAGEEQAAMRSARRLIDAFDKTDAETIVVNAAGCGSAMKRYGHLLRNDPAYAERASAFAAKCRDISEVLVDLEPRAIRGRINTRVAYHDACHLQHAQGVRVPPRRLLQGIPGVEVRDVAEAEICCGSAGIYNMLEPEAANQLRDRKVANIMRTEPDVIVSSNPGCLLQIATGFDKAGRHVPVMHMIELLDRSIAEGRRPST